MSEGKTKVGINGFGRIGKLTARYILCKDSMQIVAINDPMLDAHSVTYLLKHDSVHGKFHMDVCVMGKDCISVNGCSIRVFSEKDPNNVPWKEVDACIIAECSGFFTSSEKSQAHLNAGAHKVILSSPAKDETPTLVLGVNAECYDPTITIISNASCTTNCMAPLAKLLNDRYGIEEGLMSTVHAVTASQRVVDGPGKKDLRSGRAAGCNIIPATTGAAQAVVKAIPELNGKITGMAFRVPVENVSVLDFTVKLKNPLQSIDELVEVIRNIEQDANHPMHGIIGVTTEEAVSSDFNGDCRSCIVDAGASMLLNPTFVKIVAYYDNEWGYAARMGDMMKFIDRCDHAQQKA